MSVKIVGIKKALQQLHEVQDFLRSTKPMGGIVEDIKIQVLEKTARGLDYRGRSFAKYSERYKNIKRGMTATGRPNLKRSGTMMNAVAARAVNARRGMVHVRSLSEPGGGITSDFLAQIHTTGTGKQPQREFMNVTDSAFKKLVKKHYDDPILEIVRRYR